MYSQSRKLQLHIERWFRWSILCNAIECNRMSERGAQKKITKTTTSNHCQLTRQKKKKEREKKLDAKFRVSLMVECIAKVSHSTFAIVCILFSIPIPRRLPASSALENGMRKKKKLGKNTVMPKSKRKIIEMNEERYFVMHTIRERHASVCVCVWPPCFDPLFMIISMLMFLHFFRVLFSRDSFVWQCICNSRFFPPPPPHYVAIVR